MKNIKPTIIRITITVLATVILLTLIFAYLCVWFDKNRVVIKLPLVITFQRVITITRREQVLINPVVGEIQASEALVKKFEPQNDIEAEIYAVFGEEHFDKAMLILTSDSCHENKTLDPKAVNKNYTKDGKVASIDYGIFQINDHWQGVTNANFLFDTDINIRMAWNIYKNSDFTFSRWTCGKKLGI